MVIESTEKMAAFVKKTEEDINRLQSERAAELEMTQSTRVVRAAQEAARDKAKEEVHEQTLVKEDVCGQLKEVRADLTHLQSQTAAERAAARVANEQARLANERRRAEDNALEAAKTERAGEEEKLQAVQVEIKELDTQKANVDRMVNGVKEGIGLIADGVLVWNDQNTQKPDLMWGPAAPIGKEKRQSLQERFWPAQSLIRRIAEMVNTMVKAVLATERKQLAEDAAFVVGLRDDWAAEERAKLESLSPPDLDP